MSVRTVRLTAAVLIAFLLTAAPALAATATGTAPGGTDFAQNLANLLEHWATLIIMPIAAIVALPALFQRQPGIAITVALIAIVVGAFAYEPGEVQSFITNVVNTIFG